MKPIYDPILGKLRKADIKEQEQIILLAVVEDDNGNISIETQDHNVAFDDLANGIYHCKIVGEDMYVFLTKSETLQMIYDFSSLTAIGRMMESQQDTETDVETTSWGNWEVINLMEIISSTFEESFTKIEHYLKTINSIELQLGSEEENGETYTTVSTTGETAFDDLSLGIYRVTYYNPQFESQRYALLIKNETTDVLYDFSGVMLERGNNDNEGWSHWQYAEVLFANDKSKLENTYDDSELRAEIAALKDELSRIGYRLNYGLVTVDTDQDTITEYPAEWDNWNMEYAANNPEMQGGSFPISVVESPQSGGVRVVGYFYMFPSVIGAVQYVSYRLSAEDTVKNKASYKAYKRTSFGSNSAYSKWTRL